MTVLDTFSLHGKTALVDWVQARRMRMLIGIINGQFAVRSRYRRGLEEPVAQGVAVCAAKVLDMWAYCRCAARRRWPRFGPSLSSARRR